MVKFKKCSLQFATFTMCLIAATAQAGNAEGDTDAAACIVTGQIPSKLGPKFSTQTLKNTCSKEVSVVWCHSPSSHLGTKDSECNHGGKYYQQSTTLNPGEAHDNFYTMPEDSTVNFGACFGSIKQTTNGEYLCKPPKTASTGTATATSTASAPTAEEACKKVQSMAGKSATSECTCQVREQMSVCRVDSPGSTASLPYDTAKGEIREATKCDPDDKKCIATKQKNASIGVRN